MVTSSFKKHGRDLHSSALCSAAISISRSLPEGSRHMSDHRFFHLSVVSGIAIASYFLDRASATTFSTDVSCFLSPFMDAFEISSKVRRVEMVADSVQEAMMEDSE